MGSLMGTLSPRTFKLTLSMMKVDRMPMSSGPVMISKHFQLPTLQTLCEKLPAFPVHGSQIRILLQPQDFYNELVTQAAKAQTRVILASLYLGNGELEHKLVSTLYSRCQQQPNLQVKWLLDHIRASRGKENSRTMLLPLLQSGSRNCQVSLYHTPQLRGLLKYFMPQRWNEIVGLQHIKAYIFDNTIILSGANLSNDYFYKRQDRYIVIENSLVSNFYADLIQVISHHSLQLTADDCTIVRGNSAHPFKGNADWFNKQFKDHFQTFWDSEMTASFIRMKNLQNTDTLILPTAQLPECDVHIDSNTTLQLLKLFSKDCRVYLATGYFNLTDQYMESILQSQASIKILCAHPTANSFLGAKGFAGFIPQFYTNLLNKFHSSIENFKKLGLIGAFEYKRDNWTFHGKGLWIYLNKISPLPVAATIGSPNFGYRSATRDLESQAVIFTKNETLQQALHQEQEHLFTHSQAVSIQTFKDESRHVPLWIKILANLFKKFF